jgi:hypothetical protein
MPTQTSDLSGEVRLGASTSRRFALLIAAHVLMLIWLIVGTFILRDAWHQPNDRAIVNLALCSYYLGHAALGYLLFVVMPRSIAWRCFAGIVIPIGLPLAVVATNSHFAYFEQGRHDEAWPATQYMCSFFGTWLGMVAWWWRHPHGGAVVAHRRRLKRCMRRMVLATPALRGVLLRRGIIGGVAIVGFVILWQVALLRLLFINLPWWFPAALWFGLTLCLLRSMHVHLATRIRDAVQAMRPCLNCGASNAETEFDEYGDGACAACRAPIQKNHWLLTDDLPGEVIAGRMLGTMIITVILGFFMFWPWLSMQSEPRGLAASVMFATTGLSFLSVNAVNRMKRFAAKRWAAQHVACRICMYALGGIPTRQGIGTCSECGTPFAVRVQKSASAS